MKTDKGILTERRTSIDDNTFGVQGTTGLSILLELAVQGGDRKKR